VPTEAPERTVRPSRRRILLDADAPNPPA